MDLVCTSSDIVQRIVDSSSLVDEVVECYSPSNEKSWRSFVFKTVEEINDFYGHYAYRTDFSIRSFLKSRNNSRNKNPDIVHYVRYVCNKHGFKKDSLLNPKNRLISDSPVLVEVEKVKENPEEMLRCKAGIFLKLDESANVYRNLRLLIGFDVMRMYYILNGCIF
ncbi:hypothetical protein LIER_41703 [Lithospermum erythrorhizon]|uniref:FAR1 domain-containing protein n=1 Tax=Lithospermum erythrorhizon TaxID=34254 RepID=A0AAV3RD87_LITER